MASSPLEGTKILVADADPSYRHWLWTAVVGCAATPIVASSIEEAERLARRERPAILICELGLEGGRGSELVESIHRLDPAIETIVVTEGADPDGLVDAIEKGAGDVLTKPFDEELLVARLRQALERRERRQGRVLESRSPLRVLILDDDTTALGVMGALMTKVGANVHLVSTLDEARQILTSVHFDVLVIDVFVKAESSLAFIREAKEKEPFLPVVVVTASRDPAVAIDAVHAGAHDVVVKGVSAEEFQAAVLKAGTFRQTLDENLRLHRVTEALRAGLTTVLGTRPQAPAGQPVPDNPAAPGTAPAETVPVDALSARTAQGDPASPMAVGSLFALAGLPIGLMLIDGGDAVLESNAMADSLLAPSRGPLADAPDLAPIAGLARQARENGGPVKTVDVSITRSGVTRHLRCGACRLGEDDRILVHVQDISMRRYLEHHTRRVDGLATLGMMAAGLVHIIHSPVNRAVTYLDLMLKDPIDPARVEKHGPSVHKALRKATEAASRLLWLARSQGLVREPCNLHAVIRGACDLLERQLELGSHELDLDFAATRFEAHGDPVLFELLFLCLLLHVTDTAGRPGKLRISTTFRAPILAVAMRHTGLTEVPDAPTTLDRDRPPSDDSHALMIGRNYVERVGGSLDFAADDDGVPTLTVLIPVMPGEQPAQPAPADPDAAS